MRHPPPVVRAAVRRHVRDRLQDAAEVRVVGRQRATLVAAASAMKDK